MKVVVGMVVGLALGVAAGIAAIVAYAVGSDQDVREVFARARRSVESIDLEAVGTQVQERIAQAGAAVEETVAKAQAMAGDADKSISEATEEIAANGAEAVDAIAETEPVASA